MKQIGIYLTLAYLLSWAVWLPLYGPALGLNNLPVLPLHHALGGLGPLLAALLTTWMFGRTAGVKKLLAASFRIKPLAYLAVAMFSPFILMLLAALASHFINDTSVSLSGLLTSREFPDWSLPTFFLYNLLFFGFGEEAGWRGFVLPRLQNHMSAFKASILLTVIWAIWHWPLFLYRPGYTGMDVAGIAGWVFSLLTGSILLTWLFNSSRASILICAVFHATVDIAFTADFADKNMVNYMGFLITVWGIVTIIIFKPLNLSADAREKV